ncbi:MAG: TlpA disulfide reductase family protein [Ferruginibacter sp.]
MKKLILPIFLLLIHSSGIAQVNFDALSFTPQFPKAGEKVTFKFTKNYSPLINEKNIDLTVYLFSKKGLKVIEPLLTKQGNIYSGSFKLDSNTNTIAFGLKANEINDNNKGKGYIIPVYNNKNIPVRDHYLTAGQIYNGYGEYLFQMEKDPTQNLVLLEKGINEYPDARMDFEYYNAYLNGLNAAKKKEAQPFIMAELKQVETKQQLSEKDYSMLVRWYTQFKMKSISDSFLAIQKSKFPEGEWKKQELTNNFYKEKSADKKKDIYLAYVKNYPPKDTDKDQYNYLKSTIAYAFAKEKIFSSFREWSKDLPMSVKASLYNNVSWEMAKEKTNLEEAKQISYEATSYAKKEMKNSTGKQPESMTRKQWEENRKQEYGMYADTYGFILYNMGQYKAGLPYAKDGAESNKFKNSEYNERYALFLEKAVPLNEAKKVIEQFVTEGTASSKTKEALKNIYIKEHKSDNGYAEYLSKLERAAKIMKSEALAKTMINEASPKFNLKDFEGKEVSLESMKGKVLVVDFWATWCGPCIASMPAMKIAQEKFKDRDDVKFLFVDTWESEEDKKQNALDFMKKSNYPFYVLMDDENIMVSDFKVSGIPTKFIIDKNGKTRFKSIGFSGNDDALVEEVSEMIEMASK